MANRWDLIRVSLARRFFLATLLQAAVVLLFAVLLGTLFGRQSPAAKLRLPWSFLVTSAFLAIGSVYLEKARGLVKRERQAEFRQALLKAFGFAMAFVSVQGYGLWAIDKGSMDPQVSQLGVHGFVVMLTAIHAMHFLVAQSVLLWVTLSAFADRYDHEYFWGVTFAACLWHGLGVVWCGILVVFTMAFIA
jgi:heme/copper-type cytochrome/quinol oxidase subunit 3